MIARRNFLGILAGAIAAPIIVRQGLIMPVKALKPSLISALVNPAYTGDSWALDAATINDAALRYFMGDLMDDAIMFGRAYARVSPAGIERIPLAEMPA